MKQHVIEKKLENDRYIWKLETIKWINRYGSTN